MAYEIQFARITNSGKLQDRFLTCQEIEPETLSKASMGKIFTFLEILSPWFPTAQIGQLIITNFAKFYYEGQSTSDLVNFEEALKKVNENLAQITSEGETDWIGNLNGLMMAIVNDNMHIAPSGQVEAYLFRDGKTNQLTEGMSDASSVHPLKTFSNIVSGELKNQDKLLIANRELFNHISLDSIAQIVTINAPNDAALQITRFLRKARVKNVNAIIINLISKEELSSQPVGETDNVFYLDKAGESFGSRIFGFWQNLLVPLGRITSTKIKNLGKSPKLPEKLAKEKEEIEPLTKSQIDEKTIENDRFHEEFLSENSRDDNLLKDEEITYSPELVHYYKNERQLKETKQSKFSEIGKKILPGIKSFIGWLIAIYKDKSRRKYLYIACSVLIILIIVLYVNCNNRSSKIGTLQAQKILDEAFAAQNSGKDLLNDGKQDQAKDKFAEAIDKANSILSNNLVAKDAQSIITTSNQEIDNLTSTTRFNELTALNSISEAIKGIYVSSGSAYLVGENNIYSVNLIGGSPTKIGTLSKGEFSCGTRIDKTIYLFTTDQTMYTLDTTTGKLTTTKLDENANWETANSIFFYSNNLYLLDGVLGEIYRHSISSNQFASGESYVSSSSNLKQASSLAIDGSVYVLKSTGEVLKYQKGKLQTFSLKNTPTPYSSLEGAVKIYTDSDTPSLYLLDQKKKRILEYDKEGQYLHQYALPQSFDKMNDFAVSAKSRKIWITNNNNIYEIAI